jgi:hypothetical protein
MPEDVKIITESLIENSKSAIIGCVELHNKPIFPYRYEVCSILAINGWELLLKAYIAQNNPEIKLINKENRSKPFEECVSFVSSKLGKSFKATEENLNRLYDYRCHIIHFYKDKMDTILYSLLHKTILFFNSFLKEHFNNDLTEQTNLMLLPIGFKPFASPVDFLSKKSEFSNSSIAVKKFIESIIHSTKELCELDIEEAILTGFNMAVINENRIKNADIIAGISAKESEARLTITNLITNSKITDDETARKIKIDEESLFNTLYVLSYYDVINKCRLLYSDFKQDAKFNRIMKTLKGNPEYHKKRFLDIQKQMGAAKDWYTNSIFLEFNKHYKLKDLEVGTLQASQIDNIILHKN